MAIGGRKKIWRPKNGHTPLEFVLSPSVENFNKKFTLFQNDLTFLSGEVKCSDLESLVLGSKTLDSGYHDEIMKLFLAIQLLVLHY